MFPGPMIFFRIILLLSLSFCWLPPHAAAERPILHLDDYRETVSLNGREVFLIQKGDDLTYARPKYDDSGWRTIALPSHWNDLYPDHNGVCWYRLHIRFPDHLPEKGWGIRLGTITDSDEVFFNGEKIGGAGSIDDDLDSAYDKKRYYEIPTKLIRPGEDNVLAVRIRGKYPSSNGSYTGMIRLQEFGQIVEDILLSELFKTMFIVIYLVFFVFFLSFYLNRTQDRENLYFALFVLAVSLYFFFRTQLKYILGMDFYVTKRLEYIVLFTTVPLMLEFLRSYFNHRRHILYLIFYAVHGIGIIFVLFSGRYIYWTWFNHNIIQPAWLLLGVPSIFYILIRNVRKSVGARAILASMGVLILTLINDVLVDRNVYAFMRIFNYGFLAFIGSMALSLNNRFIRLHNEVEDLNLHLEEKVRQRTGELELAHADLSWLYEMNQRDLRLASRVQEELKPKPVQNRYWSYSVLFRPASTISGDFYDFYNLDDKTLGMVLADVSGHGIASALITMIAKPIFFQAMKNNSEIPLREILLTSNRQLNETIGQIDNYLTAVLVRFTHHHVHIVNAAHPPVLYQSRKYKKIVSVESSGSFLGIEDLPMDHKSVRIRVSKDDRILFYTDSLVESRNREGEEFGLQRVLRIMESEDGDPEDLTGKLWSELRDFTGEDRLKDDLTIICARREK